MLRIFFLLPVRLRCMEVPLYLRFYMHTVQTFRENKTTITRSTVMFVKEYNNI
jgi:hypothetical protein